MKKLRVAAVIVLAAALVVLLLDWTLGALDVFYIRRLADVRRARAAMATLDGGALALRPDVVLRLGDGGFTLRTDAGGFRVPADGRPMSAAGGTPIALLGDGGTLGWGVDDALTFARRLEPRLADLGRRADVHNAGELFARADDLVAILDARVLPAAPRLVVVCGPVSDRALPDAWTAIAARTEPAPPWWGRILPSIWAVSRRLRDGPPAPRAAPLDRAAWARALTAIRERCAAKGIGVVGADLGAAGFADACADAGVACVSAGLRRDDVDARTTDTTERFPTVASHARIAEGLAAALAPRLR